jgi:hypothetical protein
MALKLIILSFINIYKQKKKKKKKKHFFQEIYKVIIYKYSMINNYKNKKH